MRSPFALSDTWVLLAVAVATLAVYLPRLCSTLALMGDSAIFVSAAAVWGVPQPSGYPLYTALGHLFSLLPFGELPWRVHLTSALFHAGAACLVAALLRRLGASRWAAAGGALFLAFSRAFFQGSLYAEVFPLNDLFTAALLGSAVRLHLQPPSSTDSASARRALLGLALLIGLASTHHQMIALMAPALALLVARGPWRLLTRVRTAGLAAFLFAAPLAAGYALIPLAASRNPAISWGEVHDLRSLLALFTRSDYGGLLSSHLGAPGAPPLEQLQFYAGALWRQFGGVGLLLAALGALWVFRSHRWVALALLLTFVVSGPLFTVANALPLDREERIAFAERFTTMSALPVGIWVGLGLGALAQWLAAWRVGWLVLAPALVPLLSNATLLDLSGDRRGIAYAHDLLRSLPRDAVVLIGDDTQSGAAAWQCDVEQACNDSAVFAPGQLHMAWRVAQLRRRHPGVVIPEVGPERERAVLEALQRQQPGHPVDPRVARLIPPHELVQANLGRHPVFAAPSVLNTDPVLSQQFELLPDGLLLRVVGPGELGGQRERFQSQVQALARGEDCEGCAMRSSELTYPSLERNIPAAYAQALLNDARFTQYLLGDDTLAGALQARAQAIDPETSRTLR